MALLTYRRGRLDRVDPSGRFIPATSYTVVAYSPGAQVAGNQPSVTAITVVAGHGFALAGGAYFIVMRRSGGLWSMVANSLRLVSTATLTQINFSTPLSVLDDDFLVNLGVDSLLAFTGSDAVIYSSSDSASTPIPQSRLTPNTQGEYEYWKGSSGIWELILSGTTPVELVLSTANRALVDDLRVDYDHDGFDEVRVNIDRESYGFFGPATYADFAVQNVVAQASLPAGVTSYNNFTSYTEYTGNRVAPLVRNGIFSVMRYGSAGVGGGCGSSTTGNTDIAAGIYNEYRGDATVYGPSIAAECYTSIYAGQSIGYGWGVYGAVQVSNATLGGTGTVRNDAIGVYGITKTITGSNSVITGKAIGVQGVTNFDGAGTVADAISFYATAGKTGATTVTRAYGLRVDSIATGNTDNYGVYIAGASGGSGINGALYVASGNVSFLDTAANAFTVAARQWALGDGTANRNVAMVFNNLTSGDISPQFVFKGADGASASFEFTRAIRNVSPQGALWIRGRSEELIVIAASATSTSVADLCPANSIIEGVCYRVTAAITCTATFSVGDNVPTATRFGTGIAKALNTNGVLISFQDSTGATGPVNVTARKILITPDTTPSDASGRLRVTVFYRTLSAPTA